MVEQAHRLFRPQGSSWRHAQPAIRQRITRRTDLLLLDSPFRRRPARQCLRGMARVLDPGCPLALAFHIGDEVVRRADGGHGGRCWTFASGSAPSATELVKAGFEIESAREAPDQKSMPSRRAVHRRAETDPYRRVTTRPAPSCRLRAGRTTEPLRDLVEFVLRGEDRRLLVCGEADAPYTDDPLPKAATAGCCWLQRGAVAIVEQSAQTSCRPARSASIRQAEGRGLKSIAHRREAHERPGRQGSTTDDRIRASSFRVVERTDGHRKAAMTQRDRGTAAEGELPNVVTDSRRGRGGAPLAAARRSADSRGRLQPEEPDESGTPSSATATASSIRRRSWFDTTRGFRQVADGDHFVTVSHTLQVTQIEPLDCRAAAEPRRSAVRGRRVGHDSADPIGLTPGECGTLPTSRSARTTPRRACRVRRPRAPEPVVGGVP